MSGKGFLTEATASKRAFTFMLTGTRAATSATRWSTTPPIRNTNDPMLAFYRDTFASQAAKDQPIYDMKKAGTALDQLLECPDDQRIAVEGGLQRVASVIVMHDLFSMT
jgi:hypothetical protein